MHTPRGPRGSPKMPEMVRTAAPRSCMYASAIARGVALICVPSSTVWPGTSTWYTDVDENATTDGTRRRKASQKGSTEASCIGKVITTARSDAGSGSPAPPQAPRLPTDSAFILAQRSFWTS